MIEFLIGGDLLRNKDELRASMLQILAFSENGMEIRLVIEPGALELSDWMEFLQSFFLVRRHEQLADGRIIFELYPTVRVLH